MDIEKKVAETNTPDTEEEVVFSGNVVSEKKNDSDVKSETNEDTEVTFAGSSKPYADKKEENSTDDEEETVVFASAQSPSSNHKSTNRIKTAKKKFPAIPVIAGSVVVIAAAVSGIVFAMNYNSGSAPTLVETQSQASQSSKSAGVSEKEESTVSALPVIREESAEIKTINTATIVFGDNVTVAGVDLSGKTLSEAYDAMQDRLLELRDDIDITINCDGKTVNLTQDDFEFDTDISDVLIQAYHYSRGELDSPTIDTLYNDGKTDFVVTSVINSNSVPAVVKKVAEKIDIQPVDAHVKSFEPTQTEKFTYEDGSDGYLIDQNDLNGKITDIVEQASKKGTVSISAVKTPYKITLAEIKANTKLIASHYTTANNRWESVYNMELAIKSANGYVVNPGETFSFNTMTGDTTNGNLGYLPSTAIVQGKYEDQYGGGICQASTTLYLCALKADMEVIERHAHQYPSVYASRGLDATVDYGNLDMQFKNNKDYAIYIATYVYDYNGDGLDELCVEMYGPLSTEYDEIVPVGWVNSVSSESYSAKGAKVYFKDGKEIKRELLPAGSYDFKYDTYSYAVTLLPSDTENGPTDVSPTYSTPEVLSPSGCGSNAPIAYGTADEYLRQATTSSTKTNESSKASN